MLAAQHRQILAGGTDCVLPCEREAVLLVSLLSSHVPSWVLPLWLSSQARAGSGSRAPPGPRLISSPPQLELVLLPSPSRYLIAGEPDPPLPGLGSCAGQISVASCLSSFTMVSALAGGKTRRAEWPRVDTAPSLSLLLIHRIGKSG